LSNSDSVINVVHTRMSSTPGNTPNLLAFY